MTQEDKELLLKDLCARLPYGVKFASFCEDMVHHSEPVILRQIYWNKDYNANGIEGDGDMSTIIEFVKPYLRPISSMTEEEFEKLKEYSELKYDQLDLASYQNGTYKCLDFYLSEVPSYVVILVFDWLNKHYFDYRGLIKKGLALEASKFMYNN